MLGNNYVFKTIPSKSTSIDQIVNLVVDSFKTDNLIVVERDSSVENSLVSVFVKTYNNRLLEVDDTLGYSSPKTLFIDNNYSELIANLKIEKNNVIFIPIADQTYITNLFNYLVTRLTKKDYENYQVTVIGQEEWLNYENIDLEYYQKLNVCLPVSQHIESTDSITDYVIRRYINRVGTYPSKNAILGYDLANFFGTCFIKNGTVFNQDVPETVKNGLSLRFNFYKTGVESGYENTSLSILKFDDYTLKRVQ